MSALGFLIALAAAVATSVIAAIGFFLAKGSAEAVYDWGYRSGYAAAEAELCSKCSLRELAGANVSFLPSRKIPV